MDNKYKTWFITGCSSGFGHALAQEILKAGHSAVVTARDITKIQDIAELFPETALVLSLDVTNRQQVLDAVRRGEEKFGTLDVLVNNAGFGFRGAVEEADQEEIHRIFNTNFFGSVNMIQAVLPGMRAGRAGMIMNFSSIAGRFGPVGSGYYSATKFAIEGLSDALRKEVSPLGIKILLIEPGAFRTDFGGRSLNSSKKIIDDYESTVGPRRIEPSDGRQPGDPVKAARLLIKIAGGDELPFRLLLGSDAIQIIREELDGQLKELEKWEALSLGTDFS